MRCQIQQEHSAAFKCDDEHSAQILADTRMSDALKHTHTPRVEKLTEVLTLSFTEIMD